MQHLSSNLKQESFEKGLPIYQFLRLQIHKYWFTLESFDEIVAWFDRVICEYSKLWFRMHQSAFTWPFCSLSLGTCGLGVSLLPPLEKGHLSWLVGVATSVLLEAPRNQMMQVQVTFLKMSSVTKILIADKGVRVMSTYLSNLPSQLQVSMDSKISVP